MRFSYEELYAMYGRYDVNIYIQFRPGSEPYEFFGGSLMGDIIYIKGEREELEKTLKLDPVPRTEKMVRILPSSALDLTSKQYEQAEHHGVLCRDIIEISSLNGPRTNSFTKVGNRELPVPKTIFIPTKRGEGSRLMFGLLDGMVLKNEQLSPQEVNLYFGLANYLSVNTKEDHFTKLPYEPKEARYFELKAKYEDLVLNGEEIEEFGSAIADRYLFKEEVIKKEFERSGEAMKTIANAFGDEIENARNACHKFEEERLLFGPKLVYLDLDRFLHIYCRHVSEAQVGGGFAGKSVFQYKYDDVLEVIKLVVKSQSSEIEEHFKNNPDKMFFRKGNRAVYLYGNYYHIEIEPSGRLLTFYPYQNKAAAEADTKA